jgi:2,3-bisphosphoglycerate-independent phosphoglycerate mutase
MIAADGGPHTAHTTNPVPLVVTQRGAALKAAGELADLAPTALHLLGFEPPAEMAGKDLLAGP